jgi:hypothetical protein
MKHLVAFALLMVAGSAFAADGFRPLFNGKDLTGWKLRKEGGDKTWSVKDGILVNDVSGGKHGTDLVSEAKFRDFVLRYEYKVAKKANSGVYLRGRIEIQVLDDFERGTPTKGGNGAIYNTGARVEVCVKTGGRMADHRGDDQGRQGHGNPQWRKGARQRDRGQSDRWRAGQEHGSARPDYAAGRPRVDFVSEDRDQELK